MNRLYLSIIFLFLGLGLLFFAPATIEVNPSQYFTPYSTNIEKDTLKNEYYRKVLYTTPDLQLVIMSLAPKEEIGMEQHRHLTQFIRCESGQGMAVIEGKTYPLSDGYIIMIPPNAHHNIINLSSTERLQLYTIYSPPHHLVGTIHPRKGDDHGE